MDDALLVVDFLNTVDLDEGTDVLNRTETWRQWTTERDLHADPLPVTRTARAALRAAIGDPDVTAEPLRAPLHVELAHGRPALVARSAVGAVLAAAARLAVLGEWERLKICPADHCRWAFYDRSRNRSRTWCSMRACGNREKARNWRRRATSLDRVTHNPACG
ncbi:MAG TPA: CGNR zinc finger domain-containing protein [Amycolatopsis sp.]|nr:CGNR zinc finger domain-containing protein [Amycolatopsis sp.]